MELKYNLNIQAGTDFYLKKNHWLPRFLGVECFAFHKTLYSRTCMQDIPKHEFLHIAQFDKYGIFRVALHYFYHLIKNYIQFRNFRRAFRQVPFEVEAREYEALSPE